MSGSVDGKTGVGRSALDAVDRIDAVFETDAVHGRLNVLGKAATEDRDPEDERFILPGRVDAGDRAAVVGGRDAVDGRDVLGRTNGGSDAIFGMAAVGGRDAVLGKLAVDGRGAVLGRDGVAGRDTADVRPPADGRRAEEGKTPAGAAGGGRMPP